MATTVIIGAGECGVRAAFTLRDMGHDGEIVLLDAEDALPYERPPLSKSNGPMPKAIRAREAYANARIDLRPGVCVTDLMRETKEVRLASGERLRYDTLLLATGARARLFAGMEGCLTLRTSADAQQIFGTFADGAKVGVIGGGFIGLELAAAARMSGAEVTVIETASRILGRAVPEQIAAIVHARHEAESVRIMTDRPVASAGPNWVTIRGGERFDFDVVIAGVGSMPNTDLAARAGLQVDNGIVVDNRLRTSDPAIFAAGDCCNFDWRGTRIRLESWKAAQDQGAHAAAAMLGPAEPYRHVPWFWSDQFDLTLQVAGLFDLKAPILVRPTPPDTAVVFQTDADGRLRAAAGIGRGNATAREMSVLEKLIERATVVSIDALSDPDFKLKSLLKV